MPKTIIRSYRGLMQFDTHLERFEYLKLAGAVGAATFGAERYLNQEFYRSREWKMARRDAIIRDEGCDLGIPGYEIGDKIMVHHIKPITIEDVEEGNPIILSLDNLICCSHITHNAIHYGNKSTLALPFVERQPGDTKLWGKRA